MWDYIKFQPQQEKQWFIGFWQCPLANHYIIPSSYPINKQANKELIK